MIVADTTILVYAVGGDHHLRDPARALLRLAQHGELALTTTIDVVQEFLHVRARRRPREDAVALANAYALGLAPLLRPDEADLEQALDLYLAHEQLGAFDAVLAAATRRRGWALASADEAFVHVEDLVVLDASSATFLDRAKASR